MLIFCSGYEFYTDVFFSQVNVSDYSLGTEVLTFPACTLRQCVNVSIIDDMLQETNESFSLTLERSPGLDSRITLDPAHSTVIILNDDSKCKQLCYTYIAESLSVLVV